MAELLQLTRCVCILAVSNAALAIARVLLLLSKVHRGIATWLIDCAADWLSQKDVFSDTDKKMKEEGHNNEA